MDTEKVVEEVVVTGIESHFLCHCQVHSREVYMHQYLCHNLLLGNMRGRGDKQ